MIFDPKEIERRKPFVAKLDQLADAAWAFKQLAKAADNAGAAFTELRPFLPNDEAEQS